ncbi:THO complex subunit 5 homolog [Lepeophtheirus salmonis]|uniref:THO complex subunit 5 homolog n=1 Tax=Lepeophtheirus salmonis TaxID=72036 RepID=UPI003AF3ADF9
MKSQLAMHFLSMKKINRLDKIRLRRSREMTMSAKQRVDSFHLQLQNLKYEVMHLQKEITKCRQFRSKDQDISLVSIEEFYKDAPTSISNPEKTKNDEHAQRKARLEWEMEQRKNLAEKEKDLKLVRDNVEKLIREKQDKLLNLKPQLQAILEATKPVQEYLKMPYEEERVLLSTSKFLPAPLFVLFSQISAYRRASDKRLKIDIDGDCEEAKEYMFKQSSENSDSDYDDEINNADEDDKPEESNRKKGSSGKNGSSNSHQDKKENFFECHPLCVSLVINHGNDGVGIVFKYLLNLRIVLAKVTLNLSKESKVDVGEREVLHTSSLLAHLTCYDPGDSSPDPSSIYLLKKAGMEEIPDSVLEEHGLPYIWAQNLAGFDFPEALSDEHRSTQVDENVCISKVDNIVLSVRNRLESRLSLQRQVSHLEKAKVTNIELNIPEEFKDKFPARISSRIRNWGAVDFEQYSSLEVAKHLQDIIDKTDFIYRLQIDRDPAKLIALIAIKPDYPRTHPIFCLNLHWNGEHNINNSEHIRALEREINLGLNNIFDENELVSHRTEILSLQIQKLLSGFDVMLEAWNATQDTDHLEFPREKTFLQPVRGRDRILPLKYNSKLQIYSQY